MMNRLRVALMIPSLTIGGSERSVSNISLALENFCDVTVLVLDASQNVYKYGGTLINLNCPVRKTFLGKCFNFVKRSIKLTQIARKNNFDILYSFTNVSNKLNCVVPVRAAKIISCRGFGDLKHKEAQYNMMLKFVNGIIFNSRAMAEHYITIYPKDKGKVFTVYNVYNQFQGNSNADLLDKEFEDFIKNRKTIVTVGRFCEEKGYYDLLKSYAILKKEVENSGLIFIGEGELQKKIKELVLLNHMEREVLFLGYKENPAQYMEKCNVYALSSITEGFPNSMMEAMFCGLPVVSTNCRSGPDEILFRDYDNKRIIRDMTLADFGIITPPFSSSIPEVLNDVYDSHYIYAQALKKMLTDEEMNKHYRIQSKERALDFTCDYIIKDYLKVFNDLTEQM